MNSHSGDKKVPFNGEIFKNLDSKIKKADEYREKNEDQFSSSFLECIFNRLERVCLLLWGDFFNEEDAARLFRLPDPSGKGKETIRNYALRSKKLPFAKAGRHGLLFHRKDCEKLFHSLRNENFDSFLN